MTRSEQRERSERDEAAQLARVLWLVDRCTSWRDLWRVWLAYAWEDWSAASMTTLSRAISRRTREVCS